MIDEVVDATFIIHMYSRSAILCAFCFCSEYEQNRVDETKTNDALYNHPCLIKAIYLGIFCGIFGTVATINLDSIRFWEWCNI